jgi:hypothetical protein
MKISETEWFESRAREQKDDFREQSGSSCNLHRAGIAIIANIAMTIPAQTPGLDSP